MAPHSLDEMTWEQRFYAAYHALVEMEARNEGTGEVVDILHWRVDPAVMRQARHEANVRRAHSYLQGIARRSNTS